MTLKPKISGRSLTMMVTLKGTVLVPRSAEDGKYLPTDSFMNLSTGTNYTFGDGGSSGSDGGSVTCVGSQETVHRAGDVQPDLRTARLHEPRHLHVHLHPGYCGGKGSVTKSVKVVIR